VVRLRRIGVVSVEISLGLRDRTFSARNAAASTINRETATAATRTRRDVAIGAADADRGAVIQRRIRTAASRDVARP
jgi:hypothetical protein